MIFGGMRRRGNGFAAIEPYRTRIYTPGMEWSMALTGGRQVFLYPYTNMADTMMLHAVSEWTAPDAKNVGEIICYFIPVFLLCFGILFGKRDVKLRFYISASFWAFPYGLSCRMKNPESIWEKAILVCFSILLAAGCCIGAKGCFDLCGYSCFYRWAGGCIFTEWPAWGRDLSDADATGKF
ncbi:MAG: hypothetical protein HFG25_07610 [Lachnospiraceae bacterium]|nr:hypothetical protein [Lachnospiraceae bacterium]